MLRLTATRMHEIAHERRGISPETAIALGVYFAQTPEFWMNAQTGLPARSVPARSSPVLRTQRHMPQTVTGTPSADNARRKIFSSQLRSGSRSNTTRWPASAPHRST